MGLEGGGRGWGQRRGTLARPKDARGFHWTGRPQGGRRGGGEQGREQPLSTQPWAGDCRAPRWVTSSLAACLRLVTVSGLRLGRRVPGRSSRLLSITGERGSGST